MTLTGSSNTCPVNIYEGAIEAANTTKAYTTALTSIKGGGKLFGKGITSNITVEKDGVLASTQKGLPNTRLKVNGTLTVNRGGVVQVRARKTASKVSNDGFEVSGTAKFTAPVFDITLTNDAVWAAGDSIQVVKGEGRIILSGAPTFIPEVPGEGLLWDDSTFATDGTLRVIADPTGIDNSQLTIDNSQWTIYDLTGRKIETITEKGIYIINGKKVIR